MQRAVAERGLARSRRHVDAEHNELAEAIVEGLSRPQKMLPCRFLYDAVGSRLFERITRLPEYYPTRAETEILAQYASEIADGDGDGSVLVELGAGSSRKTEILLGEMPRLTAYVPIDVSVAALEEASQRLAVRFPLLDVRSMVGDFTRPLGLPRELARDRRIGFFPGSTIGNFEPIDAAALLATIRELLGADGRLVVGVDLVKDVRTLLRAYDDSAGVTAAFNLNLLARINRAFGPAFDLAQFEHRAVYDVGAGRIEMHLASRKDQVVSLLGHRFRLARGETIHTESSHKYTIASFVAIARAARWESRRVWTDRAELFSVHELVVS